MTQLTITQANKLKRNEIIQELTERGIFVEENLGREVLLQILKTKVGQENRNIQPEVTRISERLRKRQQRENETEEEMQTRRIRDRQQHQVSRSHETPQEILNRQEQDRVRQRTRRLAVQSKQEFLDYVNDSSNDEPLHYQQYLQQQFEKFHADLSGFETQFCAKCNELWPTNATVEDPDTYCCERCSKLTNPELFSKENGMVRDMSAVPRDIQIALLELTTIERMLIAPVLPVMSVSIIKKGRYKVSGFTANFHQNSLGFVQRIPRRTNELPFWLIVKQQEDVSFVQFKVNRSRVEKISKWLLEHSPVMRKYRIGLDQNNLDLLPMDGYPVDLQTTLTDQEYFAPHDQGLPDSDDSDLEEADEEQQPGQNPELVQTFVESITIQIPENSQTLPTVSDLTQYMWPEVESRPINEFDIDGLASLAFVVEFPMGHCDPTSKIRNFSLSEKSIMAHLLKYAEKHPITNEWYYPFTTDPRFLFWMNDRIRRHTALQQTDVFLKQNQEMGVLTIEELLEMVRLGDETLLRKMSPYIANIVGSQAYWYQKRQDLEAYFKTQKPATFFFTLSFADRHWVDLDRLMPKKQIELTDKVRKSRNAREFFHIADWYFDIRVTAFIKHFFGSFGYDWYWLRYEWQSRDAIHSHGCIRLTNAPDFFKLTMDFKAAVDINANHRKSLLDSDSLDDFKLEEQDYDLENVAYDMSNDEKVKVERGKQSLNVMIAFIDKFLTATNNLELGQNPVAPLLQVNPCATWIPDFNNDPALMDKDYFQQINSCQRHTRCTDRCKKTIQDGQGTRQVCSFGFPMQLQEATKIQFDVVRDSYRAKLLLKRNDGLLNVHCRAMSHYWKANTDLQIILDPYLAIMYMTKYVSKAEKAGSNLKNILKVAMQGTTEGQDPKSKIKRVMLQAVERRDVGVAETSRMLLSGSHYHSSHKVVRINLDTMSLRFNMVNNVPVPVEKNLVYYFGQRRVEAVVEDLNLDQYTSFVDFAKYFQVSKNGKLKKRNDPEKIVVLTFPNVRGSMGGPNYGKQCRYNLIKYYPWVSMDLPEIVTDDQLCIQKWRSFVTSELDQDLQATLQLDAALQQEIQYLVQHEASDNSVPFNLPPTQENLWMTSFGTINPDFVTRNMEIDVQIDLNFAWANHRVLLYSDQQLRDIPGFLDNAKRQNDPGPLLIPENRDQVETELNLLNQEQRLWFDYVMENIQQKRQSIIIILGSAGTGKSFTCNVIAKAVWNMGKVAKAAFTGQAAYLIGGKTIHSLLDIHPKKTFRPLGGEHLKRLQNEFEYVIMLMIDEFSTLSQELLYQVDQRLRQIKNNVDTTFGGLSIVFLGDPAQLPPVGAKSLFSKTGEKDSEKAGHQIYLNIKDVIFLTQGQRQRRIRLNSNEEPPEFDVEQDQFIELLFNLRNGCISEEHYSLLLKRTPGNLSPDEMALFSDATRIYQDNKSVNNWNMEKLLGLGSKITRICAVTTPAVDKKLSADKYRGIPNTLYLAVGAKMSLTTNIWTEKGLSNGVQGVVVDIVYLPGQVVPQVPHCIVIDFPSYCGPPFFTEHPTYVPLAAQEFDHEQYKKNSKRLGYPLRLAYGITAHKAQGQTMDKVVCEFGSTELNAGSAFVQLSRVRNFKDLIVCPFSKDRLDKIANMESLKQRVKYENILLDHAKRFIQKKARDNAVFKENWGATHGPIDMSDIPFDDLSI